MRERVETEVELLRKEYDKVTLSEDGQHVVIHDLPLPPSYDRDTTDVLLVVPSGYPDTPLDNFYVPSGLALENGERPDRMSKGGQSHNGRSWDQFSWHVEDDEDWRPRADPEEGTNLLTWMRGVEERLQEGD
jgi:hypothetical protein